MADVLPINIPASMQVVLGKATFVSAQTTDMASGLGFFNGELGLPSPNAEVIGGSGLYTVAFKKTAGGAEGYIGNVICVNVAGIGVTHPVLTRSINQ